MSQLGLQNESLFKESIAKSDSRPLIIPNSHAAVPLVKQPLKGMDFPEIFVGKWKLLSEIGVGSTARVYSGYNPETKLTAGIKIFNYSSEVTPETIRQEKEINQKLNHPNIIRMNESFEEIDFEDCRGEVFKVSGLVLEHALNGSLLKLIKDFSGLPETLSRTYFKQLIEAIDYLHSQNIVHRDLKPENILLDEKHRLKLADFGHSLELKKFNCSYKVGTLKYFSPEMYLDQEFDARKADLFAAAIILFCMVAGWMPFDKATARDKLYQNLIRGNTEAFWDSHEKACGGHRSRIFSDDLRDLLEKMLQPDPSKRPSIKEVKTHCWYEKETIKEDEIQAYVSQLQKI